MSEYQVQTIDRKAGVVGLILLSILEELQRVRK